MSSLINPVLNAFNISALIQANSQSALFVRDQYSKYVAVILLRANHASHSYFQIAFVAPLKRREMQMIMSAWIEPAKKAFYLRGHLNSFLSVAPACSLSNKANEPTHPLMKKLIELSFNAPREGSDLLKDPSQVSTLNIRHLAGLLRGFEKDLFEGIRAFERKGGKVVITPLSTAVQKTGYIGIQAEDLIKPVCKEGVVLSQIAGLVAKAYKWRQGMERGAERVALGFGTVLKNDRAARDSFTKDFFKRAFREERASPIDYYEPGYWVHNYPSRTIFIAFNVSCINALSKLCRANVSLKNCVLVIIPDNDWVSLHYPQDLPRINPKIISKEGWLVSVSLEPAVSSSKAEWEDLERDALQLKRDLQNPHIDRKTALYSFIQPYVYQAAFRTIAKFFKTVS